MCFFFVAVVEEGGMSMAQPVTTSLRLRQECPLRLDIGGGDGGVVRGRCDGRGLFVLCAMFDRGDRGLYDAGFWRCVSRLCPVMGW